MSRRFAQALPLPAVLVTALTVTGGSCQRDQPGPHEAASRAASTRTAAPPPSLPPGVRPGSDERGPDGVLLEPLPGAPGEWSDNKLYRFRLERLAACGGEGVAGSKAASSWVGAYFTVHAKQPEVFVTPRDLELRRGGVILNAKYVNPPRLPGCEPLLVPRRMRFGETIAGFAVFEVPGSFRVTTDDPIVLSYRPTRWGGARRADVPIRECLDGCGATAVSKASKPTARNSLPALQN
jgi:hypothetical protein